MSSSLSLAEVKKQTGNLVVKANEDILELQKCYRKVKPGGNLSKQGESIEAALKTKIQGLQSASKF